VEELPFDVHDVGFVLSPELEYADVVVHLVAVPAPLGLIQRSTTNVNFVKSLRSG